MKAFLWLGALNPVGPAASRLNPQRPHLADQRIANYSEEFPNVHSPTQRLAFRTWFAGLVLTFWISLGMLVQGLAQVPQALVTNLFSREFTIHVGGRPSPELREIVSRESSLFSGDEPVPALAQAASREWSVIVTTPAPPNRVSPVFVRASPTGEQASLSWWGYNEWAEKDIVRYEIYVSNHSFTNVQGMVPLSIVQAELFTATLTNLAAWEDHFFAVVAVDAAESFDPRVQFTSAYVIAGEVESREYSCFVGGDNASGCCIAASRESSVLITTPDQPEHVTSLTVRTSATGDAAELSWSGYNEWANKDVVRYDVYLGDRSFGEVTGMAPIASVPAETFAFGLSNLTAWADHFFAVIAVDARGGFDSRVVVASSYVLAGAVASREYTVDVGAESSPRHRMLASHEISMLVTTPEVPAPVTCANCGLTARDSMNSYSAFDLDWESYNETGQQDVIDYRIYLAADYFEDVSALSPYMIVPAETKNWTVSGLLPYGVYYVAVVAEDALGQFNPRVRAQLVQASTDRLHEAQNLAVDCGPADLRFTWDPPEGANPHLNELLAGYRLYFAGSATPIELDRLAVSYHAVSLIPGRGYPLRLTCVDPSGHESSGISLLAATLVPNPAQIGVRSRAGGIEVSWEAVSPETVVRDFAVYVAEGSFSSVSEISPLATTRGHSIHLSGLEYGKTYYFTVISRNTAGCASLEFPMQIVSFTPIGLEISRPTPGEVSIRIYGPSGVPYILETSTDLQSWTPIQVLQPEAIPFSVTLPKETGLGQLYRVRTE